ncbi:hypothetical protein TGMAS_230400C, partial [Toxoplasma gondii MAS]
YVVVDGARRPWFTSLFFLFRQAFRRARASSSSAEEGEEKEDLRVEAPHADAPDSESQPEKKEEETESENTTDKEKETTANTSRPSLEEMKNQAATVKAAAATLFSQLWTKPTACETTEFPSSSSCSSSSSSSSFFSALLRGEGGASRAKPQRAEGGKEGEKVDPEKQGEENEPAISEDVSKKQASRETSPRGSSLASPQSHAAPETVDRRTSDEPPNISPSSPPSSFSSSSLSFSSSSSFSSSPLWPSLRAAEFPPAASTESGEPSRREKVFSSLLSSTMGGADYVKRSSSKWKDSLKSITLSRAFQAAHPEPPAATAESERADAGVSTGDPAESRPTRTEEQTHQDANSETDRGSRESLREQGSFSAGSILGFEEASGAFEVLGDVRSDLAQVARLGEAGLLPSDIDPEEDGVFEIGDDDEGENRGTSGFGPVERVGSEAGQDLMLMMKKYEMYIQEIQNLEKGSIIDLVEVQKQIGDLQIFEALKLRPIKPRWSFTLSEGVVAKNAEKKSLRWMLLTLHQLIVLEPHCSEKKADQDERGSEAGSPLKSENADAEKDGASSVLRPRLGSGVPSWSGHWRNAVISLGEKAKDALQHNAVIEQLQLQRAGTGSDGPATFETITGIITLPHAASRSGEGASKVSCWVRVKSNHKLSDLQKALHFPEEAHRLSLVLCNGKSNSYQVLARSAFLEAIQNRLASLNIGELFACFSFQLISGRSRKRPCSLSSSS